ncbi:MAG: hypothetical protein COU72_04035 [Parcubacteria group bacterium CG10_big_fil_rev_8_21_14_0_10_41_35]|nr:MAG: hypothetical protein COU72_04035 [Parcubacteria group bacterium CG10_big_fil_rev_8_21_14_0_10_41_35]
MANKIRKLRIHGDNILECESALKLLHSSLNGSGYELSGGSAYCPEYSFESDTDEEFIVQLFAGYGRWNFPMSEYIAALGGRLRESPDAIITRLEKLGDDFFETPLVSFEFSGALPAGNNAWQRTGRALALAYSGIPYIYFAELGGQELDSERVIKAARFPNPLVPFAYAVLGFNSNSISLPIYTPSPSSNKNIVEIFKNCFGEKESIELIRGIILSENTDQIKNKIEVKVSKILEILSGQRKRASSILQPKEWAEFYAQKTGLDKAEWLIRKAMPWNKKTGIKDLTLTFKLLLEIINKANAVAIGSKDMPICIISSENRLSFSKNLKSIYKNKINLKFENWVSSNTRPLVCVWVAGFKPRGDDSRPDRGLVPMARMIFGIQDVDVITIVYGPAKNSTWALLNKDMWKLAANNGLWESIIHLSNGLLIDSSTGVDLDDFGFVIEQKEEKLEKKLLPAADQVPSFGEHDIDSILHLIFSNALEYGVYESLCNPPGGDWSGIGVFDFVSGSEFRWTSLPRVSGSEFKRPDHLIQIKNEDLFLSVESKYLESTLENNIGPRLIGYVQSLFKKPPTAFREKGILKWSQHGSHSVKTSPFLSGGAFKFQSIEILKSSLARAKVDIVFGVEFDSNGKDVKVHILTTEAGVKIVPILTKLVNRLNGLVSLEIH